MILGNGAKEFKKDLWIQYIKKINTLLCKLLKKLKYLIKK